MRNDLAVPSVSWKFRQSSHVRGIVNFRGFVGRVPPVRVFARLFIESSTTCNFLHTLSRGSSSTERAVSRASSRAPFVCELSSVGLSDHRTKERTFGSGLISNVEVGLTNAQR